MPANSSSNTLLVLEIPRTNDKKELSAEQMFAALHGIYKTKRELLAGSQDHISFEIASIDSHIRFYVWLPSHLKSFVEGQIYAQYPTAQITEIDEDYCARDLKQAVIYTTELTLTDHETIPIKTFPSFEVDPLAAITATLARLDQQNEEMWVQIIVRPIGDEWHRQSTKAINRIKSGKGVWTNAGLASINYISQAIGALVRPPTAPTVKAYEPNERDKTRITAIEEKSRKLGYQVKIRILYAGNNQANARMHMQAMVGTFKQFNTTNLNGFQSKYASFDRVKLGDYQKRSFIDKGFILNIEELASVFHLPHTTVETPNIAWATTKTAEPPSNLPTYGQYSAEDISLFGITNFRGSNNMFGLLRADRGRHVYILGQTGTGKSGLLELLTLSDIYYDQGLAVIDPHGDYATNIMQYIPDRRVKDVIYFNPADTNYPIGFNPLEVSDSSSKSQISSELVGVLKRMFDSWGPRLEYILRFTLLALLDYPNSTMLDITRMLTDKNFRKDVIDHITDPVVKNFWVTEFASWNEKFANEVIAPVLNKVGAFTANPIIRNIIGQTHSSFNIRKAMDEGKILIVNLSRGLIGEDNAAILGSMLVTKIQLAAMSRADTPRIEDRRPFYLYVDEFQNFATESFAVILSEARKYALNLTVANQYISQMDEAVRNAVFGNVGTITAFRVSPDDSPFLVKYFEPQFDAADLSNFHNRHFVTSMSINGEKAIAFSGTTLNIPEPQKPLTDKIIEFSRQKYAADLSYVEFAINQRSTPASANNVAEATPKLKTVGRAIVAPLPILRPATPAAEVQSQPNTDTTALSISPDKLETESQKRRRRRKRAAEAAKLKEEAKKISPNQLDEPIVSIPTIPETITEPKPAIDNSSNNNEDETVLRLR